MKWIERDPSPVAKGEIHGSITCELDQLFHFPAITTPSVVGPQRSADEHIVSVGNDRADEETAAVSRRRDRKAIMLERAIEGSISVDPREHERAGGFRGGGRVSGEDHFAIGPPEGGSGDDGGRAIVGDRRDAVIAVGEIQAGERGAQERTMLERFHCRRGANLAGSQRAIPYCAFSAHGDLVLNMRRANR